MLEIINHENFREIVATNGYVHRLGTENYVKRAILLPNDTESDFEEIAELPKFTKEEYDAKVAELVRTKYDADAEFAIQRKMINTLLSPSPLADDKVEEVVEKYHVYNTFVEECKVKAAEVLAEYVGSEVEQNDSIL